MKEDILKIKSMDFKLYIVLGYGYWFIGKDFLMIGDLEKRWVKFLKEGKNFRKWCYIYLVIYIYIGYICIYIYYLYKIYIKRDVII